jgi:hypothetical protein
MQSGERLEVMSVSAKPGRHRVLSEHDGLTAVVPVFGQDLQPRVPSAAGRRLRHAASTTHS